MLESDPQIALYRCSLDLGASTLATLERTLSPDERVRADGFVAARSRDRFVAGRGTLRRLLGRELGCDPAEVTISGAPGEKPFIPGTELRFNLAHSGGVALYGISRRNEIGVDLELISARASLAGLAQRYFSAVERGGIAALPAHRRDDAFYECWTRKEAYLKGTGEGISVPLAERTVWTAPGVPVQLGEWSIHTLVVETGYAAAIAVYEASTWAPPSSVKHLIFE